MAPPNQANGAQKLLCERFHQRQMDKGLSYSHNGYKIMPNSYIRSLTQLPSFPGVLLSALVLPPLLLLGNPAVALIVGMTLTLLLNQSAIPKGGKYSKYLLQTAIILLGLKLNMGQMWQINAEYTGFVICYVVGSVGIGLGIGRLIRVDRVSSLLISAGTGICGGTTIATLAPILKARAEQVGITLAIVFLLNAVALFLFPLIGHALEMSQEQFGVWVALAIHDTSSVVATAAMYGEEATSIATIVKLSRTLWLIPAVLIVSLMARRGEAKMRVPTFILLFVGASILGSVLPMPSFVPSFASALCKALLVLALFLLGTEITRNTVRGIKGKILWQALALWGLAAPLTLLAVLKLVP